MALATPLLTPLDSPRPSSSPPTPPVHHPQPPPPRTTNVGPAYTKPGRGASVVLGRHSWGRPPWYAQTGEVAESYVIGIAGGSASGKTSVAKEILTALNHVPNVVILSQDSFYRYHSAAELDLAFRSELDFDHPSAIDWARFERVLAGLRRGEAVERADETQYLYGASVIIVEGILALTDERMRGLFDLKVFVNCDTDLMLARRIRRDVEERGRDVKGIIDQYLRFVKPSYDNFVLPSSKFADIIVPGLQNNVAVELIVTHIRRQLAERSLSFRSKLPQPQPQPPSPPASSTSGPGSEQASLQAKGTGGKAVLLEQTTGLLGLLTILRDRETEREDFVHYCDRLATLVVEKALGELPYVDRRVRTPVGLEADGKALGVPSVVGVSIARSGGPLEKGLRRVVHDARLGSMLIHNDEGSQEPLLYGCTLPACLKSQPSAEQSWVMLLDSQMGTGAAALMAIRVLLDHHVPASQILFLTFVVTPQALAAVHAAFPAVKVITASVDRTVEKVQLRQSVRPSSSLARAVPGARGVSVPRRLTKPPIQPPADGDDDDDDADHHRQRREGRSTKPARKDASEMQRVKVDVEWVVRPGFGDIGDRYFLI